MGVVDLTHPFPASVYNPAAFPPVRIEELDATGAEPLRDTLVSFVVHVGTHIDAPMHLRERTADVAALELDALIGPAVCWSVPCEEAREIGAAELAAARPEPRPGDRVFVHTGWDRHFADAERYALHPHLSGAAAQWLLEREVALLGTDTPTPDTAVQLRREGFDYPVHRALLARDVPIVENLANLGRVAGRRFEAFVCPIPFAGADGAPARVFARLDGEDA